MPDPTQPRGKGAEPLKMTPEQQTALAHIALIAEECAHPRYGKRTPIGTVVLTVNAGYE